VGKSALAQLLLSADGIPWLPTDVIRTVLRRVLPELDAVDTDPVDALRLAELMYPHIEQAAEVCAEEAERFLIEGFELAPSYPQRLRAALEGTTVGRAFLAMARSLQTIWPPTAARNRSTRSRPHRPNSPMPPPGFANVAISSATNAASEGFPTSMWVHWAIRSQCATRVSISSGTAPAMADAPSATIECAWLCVPAVLFQGADVAHQDAVVVVGE
jgi:hypothetical protein